MPVYLGYSRPCSPSIKDTFSAFGEKDSYLPLSPLDTSSTESSSPPTSHYDGFLVKDEPNDLFSNYLQIPNEIDPNNTKEQQTAKQNDLDKEGLFKIRVLGIPETGAKSRVETQIKLCIQLVDKKNNEKVTDYSFIRLNNTMLARSRLKKTQQNGSVIVSDSKVLDLEAKVITSCGSTDQPIRMCVGCVRRERKRAERTKEKSPIDEISTTIEEERDRILIFNCNPMINFNSGDTILPTRITCYCRHHDEKVGFSVCFVMRNDKGELVASGKSSPIMITDDHKSSKKKSNMTTENESSNNNNSSSSKKKRTRSNSIDKNMNNNNNKSQPDTPLHTPKSEKQDIPTTTLLEEAAAAALTVTAADNDGHGVSNMFQPNDNEHWPFNRRRRTNAQGHFYIADNDNDICSMPTTPMTEDEFSLSDFTSFLPFTSSFITPTPATTAPSQSLSLSIPSLSVSTLSIPPPHTSSSSSSSSLSSLSAMSLIPPPSLPIAPTTTTTSPSPTSSSSSTATTLDASSTTNFMSILNRPLMPQIDRLVPSQGPIYGGTEISVLGSGFYRGLSCVFGEQVATTLFWSENTMVCLLPPTAQPGPVVVSFKEHPIVIEAEEVSIFTYYDSSDQALLELALQLVGMKSTGKLQNAKQVAMGIIVQGKDLPSSTNSTGHTMLHLCVLLNYLDLVKDMNKTDVLLDAQDIYGMTALHLACQLGAYDMVKVLIEAGADTCVKDKLGYTPSSYIPVYKKKSKNKKSKKEEEEEEDDDDKNEEKEKQVDNFDENDDSKDDEEDEEEEKCIKDLFPVSSLSPSITIPPPPKRKTLSRRSSMKGGHLMHRFHSLTKETKVEEMTAPTMESDGLGFVQPKLDKRLYLFWLPVLIVAIGLLSVQLMGHPGLFEPLLEKMPRRLSFTV